MKLYKVIFFKLCILYSIDFAFCTDNRTELEIYSSLLNQSQFSANWNSTFIEHLIEMLGKKLELDAIDHRGNYSYTLEELGGPRLISVGNITDKDCLLPKEDHRLVFLSYSSNTVWGSVVNFTDPVNERLIEVDEFLGIPYAVPTWQNDERFAPPRMPKFWYGPAHRHKMPKMCIQHTSSRVPWAVHDDDKENLSENCLYLNIWTPFNLSGISNVSSMHEKPVLLFVHGGFFLTGSAGQEIYNGRVIAGLGDLVVVTMNYRLGAFGFWSSGRESAPGNVALTDIRMAIYFIQKYISDFGGDAARLTLAGQGAGAVAVSMLSFIYGVTRPWYRLILQSGSIINPFPADPEETIIHSYNLAIGVGCANESYISQEHPEEIETCMRGVDPFVLAEEESKMKLRPGPYKSFLPTWGSSSFPSHPYSDFLEGNYEIQEMIIGTNHFDGAFQIAANDPDRFGYFFEKDNATINANETKSMFTAMFPYVNSSDVDEVFEIYNTSEEFSNVENETLIPSLQLARAVTDLSYTCPSLFFAEKAKEQKLKVYYNDFKFKPLDGNSPWPQWMRPTHFEEVQYIFGKPFLDAEKYTVEEIELSRHMIQTWTNFTKMIPTFPRFDFATQPATDSFLENPNVQVTGEIPKPEQCNVFNKYFGRSLL